MFFVNDARAARIGERLVDEAARHFESAGLTAEDFALTLLLHGPAATNGGAREPAGYAYRGDVSFYPCSVVKSFLVVAAQLALREGRLSPHEQLERAMLDMIRWSSNTATNYVIDLLSGTTGDTLLDDAAMTRWIHARQGINRLFGALAPEAYGDGNLAQKLMDDDRYGREKVFAQWQGGNHHNRLSTNAAAWIISQIMCGDLLSGADAERVRGFHHRSLDDGFRSLPGAQVKGYLGAGLPPGSRVWSKAGRTDWTRDPLASYRRHDAAHVELPGGRRFTLAIFTQGEPIAMADDFLPRMGELASAWVAG